MSEETEPWRYPRLSDRDLLLCIGRDLKRLYAVTLQQPLPDDIEALLQRIEKAELDEDVAEAVNGWAGSASADPANLRACFHDPGRP